MAQAMTANYGRHTFCDANHNEIMDNKTYRTVWISDLHLGSAQCQADVLLDFLKHTESEKLYLVGDIIDF
jgi:hypothetical protein